MADGESREGGEERREQLTDEQRRSQPEGGEPGATEQAPGPDVATRGAADVDRTGEAKPPPTGKRGAGKFSAALTFLSPAILVLGVLIIYPTIYTAWRSLYDSAGDTFVGLEQYGRMFNDPTTLTAIKNNFVWVLVAPLLVTAFGLVFAVLIDRIKMQTAYKTMLFMPMAISFLAVGIIFRLVYQSDADIGVANAIVTTVKGWFTDVGAYPGAFPSGDQARLQQQDGGGFITGDPIGTGSSAALGLVGIQADARPSEDAAQQATVPEDTPDDAIAGAVFFDFGGEGNQNAEIDQGEVGLPGIPVQAISNGEVVASATTGEDGSFVIEGLESGQQYQLALAPAAFQEAAAGIEWLGDQNWLWVSAATWSIILAFVWMWAGFAMVILSAGLASIPREVMESARVDGASEWQVFRRITAPLLAPVILVVIVTLMINVLKIFDLVLIMAPGSVQDDATVLALRMWRVSFGGASSRRCCSTFAGSRRRRADVARC